MCYSLFNFCRLLSLRREALFFSTFVFIVLFASLLIFTVDLPRYPSVCCCLASALFISIFFIKVLSGSVDFAQLNLTVLENGHYRGVRRVQGYVVFRGGG